MSQYSSSNHHYPSTSTSNTTATTSSSTYPYSTMPPNPSALPHQAPPTSSNGYSAHRQTSSHHSNYRYHPYSATGTSYRPPQHASYPDLQNTHRTSASGYSHSSSYSQSHSSLPRPSHTGSNGYPLSHQSNYNMHHHSLPPPPTSHHSHSHSSHSHHSHHSGSKRKQKAPRNEFGIPYGQPGAGLSAPNWDKMDLPPFQKNFYREAPSITAMTEKEVIDWRSKFTMTVKGTSIPRPIRTFGEAGFPPYIMAEIARAGFKAPTPIQSQGWPMAMSGRDVIGIAETGSGKTLGFLLPCIVHINAQPLLRKGDGPIVLCIAPTRELAVQIEGEVAKFAYSSKIKHCCVYGGVSRRDQSKYLQLGVEIIICTPGRLLDFLESSTTNLFRVTYLVIDEADRLLDMGFEPQLRAILSQVRPDRQILMWSATWPAEVRELSKKFIKENDAIQVSIGSFDTKANHNVTQIIRIVEQYEKQNKFYDILNESINDNKNAVIKSKLLVFTSTKRQCDYLYRILKNDNYLCCVIHGDKQQYDRDNALNSFKSGKSQIMIATDVASRGIHIDNITHVINYDFPGNIEDYVHRIGRTGRCGNKGIAISFFTKDDFKRSNKLINVLKEAKQHIPQKLIDLSHLSYSNSNSSRQRYSNNNSYKK